MPSLPPRTYRVGPDNATLLVRTGRQGPAAKVGHDLVLLVSSWEATIEIAGDPEQSRVELVADARSLQVQEGSGGLKPLSEDDRRDIHRTIDDDVLGGRRIEFRSSTVEAGRGDGRLCVSGELSMAGSTQPVHFELGVSPDRAISASCTLRQTDWGIAPYSALLGALRVTDEVEVTVEGSLPSG